MPKIELPLRQLAAYELSESEFLDGFAETGENTAAKRFFAS